MKHHKAAFFLGMIVLLLTVFNSQATVMAAEQKATITVTGVESPYEVDEQVTVKLKITSEEPIYRYDMYLLYDPAILEFQNASSGGNGGGGQILWIGGRSDILTVVFRTKGVGTSEVKVGCNTFEVGTGAEATVTTQGTTVQVSAGKQFSGNNNLAGIKLSHGTLIPDFSPEVTEYSVNVASNVSSILLVPEVQDAKAKVVLISDNYRNLKYGTNRISITVLAENGATKEYVINCNREEILQESVSSAPDTSQADRESDMETLTVGDSQTVGNTDNADGKGDNEDEIWKPVAIIAIFASILLSVTLIAVLVRKDTDSRKGRGVSDSADNYSMKDDVTSVKTVEVSVHEGMKDLDIEFSQENVFEEDDFDYLDMDDLDDDDE